MTLAKVIKRCHSGVVDEEALRQRPLEDGSPGYGNADRELNDFHNSIIARNGRWFAKVHEVNSSWDVAARVSKVTSPTLLVYGDQCSQLRREQRMLEGIRSSHTVHIQNAGSHSYYERPDAFLAAALPFLGEPAVST